MANRVQLGDLGSGVYGLKVSKPSVNVLTATDKDLLFDSTKARTGQIYAGANGLDFVGDNSDSDPQIVGTVNIDEAITGSDLRGKKIIIDGTTVTLTSVTTYFNGNLITTGNDIKNDINSASITGIQAFRNSAGTNVSRLRIEKAFANGDMVISYPASNSLESSVGINAATYAVGIIDTNGINYLTGTGSTKAGLGYIPLITLAEANTGTAQQDGDEEDYDSFEQVSTFSIWETTATHMFPASGESSSPTGTGNSVGKNNASVFTASGPVDRGRGYNILEDNEENKIECENCSFFVLRIPLAYGYMNSTYYG